MPIKRIKHEPDPQHHIDRVVLEDHFGKQHQIVIHPFVVSTDERGEFVVQAVDVEAAIRREEKLMELREKHFLEHMLKFHPRHPKTLSHPGNRE